MDPVVDETLVTHTGGCHCGTITWEVNTPKPTLTAWKCNCTNCAMRGNIHFIVPAQNFRLLTGHSNVSTYTFGTRTAKHTFCSVCGVTSFYTPRSNPDCVAVTLACVHPGTISHVEIKCFDGLNWENSYSSTGISHCSKLLD
ncbi:hypothetical protein RND81_14G096800 [Saponaria officinalis]|uniref:CENP-V/GFA domain-containing protein n=1 Tax=Saponaria officinalis TaxID=3572 RepID=A0AAW1GQD0_SAPOF